MAFAAAAARRSIGSRLSDHLARRLQTAVPYLLTAPDSSDKPQDHPHLKPTPRHHPPRLPLHQSSRTAKTLLPLLPFGIHLAGPPRRDFSSSLPSGPAFDVGTVLSDATDAVAAAAAPASFPSEVALATEGSSLSTVAVQHLIDAVHSSTGLNWGLSIALSTVLLRCLLVPLSIMATRRVMEMKQDSSAAAELGKRVNDKNSAKEALRREVYLFKRLGLRGFVPILKPYTFMTLYFAISNMVEKVPSLKEGGAFWFTDLTTPDTLYIFPVMTSLSLMLRFELFRHYSKLSMSSDKGVERVLHILRTLIILTVPLTASLPQAFSCYFVAWSFTSLVRMIVMQQPAVKNILFGDLTKPTCPPSDGSKEPAVKNILFGDHTNPTCPPSDGSKETAAEDSPCPIELPEQPHPTERIKTSDASVYRITDQSDKK